MAVKISGVEKGGRAENLGVMPGDILLSINGHDIADVLDYRFFETERELRLKLTRRGEPYSVELVKPQYARIGLEFDTYLMDQQRSCKNKCVFCFIDQLPPGMRETLYFKDDDDRLSFLFGNYITLTNIDDREIDRILQMHISPINVSVHTMDPELRCKMMHNRFAGESLRHLYRLAEGGVKLNCQIVLCPGLNDGSALEYSLDKLYGLGESLLSVACVPVGLTRYREGLYPLKPYTKETAGDVLDILERYGEIFLRERGSRTVYASDEFYLLAERTIPPLEFYEDFPQIENGVGMLRNMQDEFDWAMEEKNVDESACPRPRKVTIPTGEGVYPFLNSLLDGLRQKCHNLTIDLFPVHNDFFGGTVNVTGLLTGRDLLKALKVRKLGDEVLLSGSMMKAGEDIFLDDMTREQLEAELGVPVKRTGPTGEALLAAILGWPAPETPGYNPYEGAWEHG